MAQLVMWLAANPNILSLSSRTHMVERVPNLQVTPDLHICSTAGVHSYVNILYTQKCGKALVIKEK